jgi:hypothetical protein
MTAFRHLKTLPYLSSYSHRGRFYTLQDIPLFDELGIWHFGDIGFSQYGTLLDSLPEIVVKAQGGYTLGELTSILRIHPQNALKQLIDQKRLIRRKIGNDFVYAAPGTSAVQFAARKQAITGKSLGSDNGELAVFLSALNERQRRLFLGYESLRYGRGGDAHVASSAGVNIKTVARGRRELLAKEVSQERVRAVGAGRPPVKKTS